MREKMSVLLVMPPVDTCYEYVMPVGLMNLCLIGRDQGFEVELFNHASLSYHESLHKVLSREYDVVGISCNFTNAAPSSMRYARDIKKRYPRTVMISGGNHATLAPEDLLYNNYDYILYGEAEQSFGEFLRALRARRPPESLRGISYLRHGTIERTAAPEPIADLDTLPFNDFSQFDLEPYFGWARLRYVNIETSRGCIYNCAFCATVRMWGHRYRHKSARRIVEEFKVAKRLGCDFVFLCDDDSALDEKHLVEFCDLLIKEDAVVPWGTTVGSCSVKNGSTMDALARSGCIKINICIESANPRILKAYRKPYTIEDNRRMCRELTRRGILVHNHGIIGFPDETLHETLNTYWYLMRTSPMWHISILEPRPGTDYWEDWNRKGDPFAYKLFGKANVILSRKRLSNYLIYRFFALLYFLSPERLWKAFFHKSKGIQYSYWIQYYVAYRTIRSNLLVAFERFAKALR